MKVCGVAQLETTQISSTEEWSAGKKTPGGQSPILSYAKRIASIVQQQPLLHERSPQMLSRPRDKQLIGLPKLSYSAIQSTYARFAEASVSNKPVLRENNLKLDVLQWLKCWVRQCHQHNRPDALCTHHKATDKGC